MSYPSLNNYDVVLKIILLGDGGVGKTSLCNRLCSNVFNEKTNATIGVDLFIKTFQTDNKSFKLQLWDTAGQERYKSITAQYFNKVSIVLLLFDYSNLESFKNLPYWINEIKTNSEKSKIILIGNKTDKKNVIPDNLIQEFIKKFNLTLLSISNKTNENVNRIYEQIHLIYLDNISDDENGRPSCSIDLRNTYKTRVKRRKCC